LRAGDDPLTGVCSLVVQGVDGELRKSGAFMISRDGLAVALLGAFSQADAQAAWIEIDSGEGLIVTHPVTSVKSYSQTLNLALLKVDGNWFPSYSLAEATQAGDAVTVVGRKEGETELKGAAFGATAVTETNWGAEVVEVAGQALEGTGYPLLNESLEVAGISIERGVFLKTSWLVSLLRIEMQETAVADMFELFSFWQKSQDGVLAMGKTDETSFESKPDGTTTFNSQRFFANSGESGTSVGAIGTSACLTQQGGKYVYSNEGAFSGYGATLDTQSLTVELGRFTERGTELYDAFTVGSGRAYFYHEGSIFFGSMHYYIRCDFTKEIPWIYVEERYVNIWGNEGVQSIFRLDGLTGACYRQRADGEWVAGSMAESARFHKSNWETGVSIAITDSSTGFSYRHYDQGLITVQLGKQYATFSGTSFSAEMASPDPTKPEITVRKASDRNSFTFLRASSPELSSLVDLEAGKALVGEFFDGTVQGVVYDAKTGDRYIGTLVGGTYEGEGSFYNDAEKTLAIGRFAGGVPTGRMTVLGATDHPVISEYIEGKPSSLLLN
jgi:hypothetical protein